MGSREDLQEGLIRRVGNGKSNQFWEDSWVAGLGSLNNQALGPLTLNESHKLVKDFVTPSRSWNSEVLEQGLPANICARILAMLPPLVRQVDDVIAWKDASDWDFNYKAICILANLWGPS